MGELIPFPKRPLPQGQENIQVTISGNVTIDCQGLIHVFGEVPGHCKCGLNYWGDDVLPPPPTIGIRASK